MDSFSLSMLILAVYALGFLTPFLIAPGITWAKSHGYIRG